MNFANALVRACSDLGLPLPDRLLESSVTFHRLLEKWRLQIALTSVHGDREWAELHFAEAFWASRFVPREACVADVGSGAGFPGIPLGLFRDDLTLSLLERNFKKSVFLRTAVSTLGLSTRVHAGPAEDWAGWSEVDLALLRALRPSAALLRRLTASGARLLHFRGNQPDPLLSDWRVVSDERYPLARARWVTLYSPPAVPRETK